jgi:hypothetical protein
MQSLNAASPYCRLSHTVVDRCFTLHLATIFFYCTTPSPTVTLTSLHFSSLPRSISLLYLAPPKSKEEGDFSSSVEAHVFFSTQPFIFSFL